MPRRKDKARVIYSGEPKKGQHHFDFLRAMQAGAHRAYRRGAAPPSRLNRLQDAE